MYHLNARTSRSHIEEICVAEIAMATCELRPVRAKLTDKFFSPEAAPNLFNIQLKNVCSSKHFCVSVSVNLMMATNTQQ